MTIETENGYEYEIPEEKLEEFFATVAYQIGLDYENECDYEDFQDNCREMIEEKFMQDAEDAEREAEQSLKDWEHDYWSGR